MTENKGSIAHDATDVPVDDTANVPVEKIHPGVIHSGIDEATMNARSAWECVTLSRRPGRPGAATYIDLICDGFMELHGDRLYGDDPAMLGGIGTVDGIPMTFIGNRKGTNLKENIAANYGMSNPEGYRKALRLARQAEKFQRPVICFIDTPGAYPGLGAEERGIGEAIAANLKVFSTLKTIVLCFILGEGGSGGALGIGVGDKLYMLENSVYSVITPEGFASILLRDASRAKEAAVTMKMTSKDLKRFNLINDIIPEAPEGAHANPGLSAQAIKKIILRDVATLSAHPVSSIVRYRMRKITGMGATVCPVIILDHPEIHD
ncbi:acetyl-CoA carboxylase carboxyltransferase subunit alpha [Parasphaerochaeta coccoides]|uniref:Acetyl-coenzyme A carboxylase carboxyl transferase subunit alpha n=1 Tax=Parasphaerochaeta coccoides (strain ATCC BAA-1237 / DSM 17374 / SPN1) TaxID=760011 RepID=F4GJM1_PARC1|nr:acetyl-CoA carboxylase carboxyltransferase subunit alpha [Parasphaerochaeta coccoides]AEC02768.1 acetyl-CoA carboxylase carboxyltransferase subunit alpha [Parasphaerochaeta coccoides DSM 17374]